MDKQAEPPFIPSPISRTSTFASTSTQSSTSSASSITSKRFKCGSCDAEFTRRNNMKRHEKNSCDSNGQKKSKYYTCMDPGCDSKGYCRLDGLTSHIKDKHGGDEGMMRDTGSWYDKLGSCGING